MTALELYKFVSKNNVEYHYQSDGDVYMFVDNYLIAEWNNLISPSTLFDEDGIKCTMKDGYFAFEMKEICDHFDIELKDVFESENEI